MLTPRCRYIGCPLKYAKEARALKHKSGWYLEVELQNVEAFNDVFRQEGAVNEASSVISSESDPIINLIKEAGFEFIDKRDKKGGLWIIAGKEEARDFVKKCESKGIIWSFAPNGSRTTKHKPGWYCR